ncbi:hypothetical protein [Streptomyces cinereoruber]|uniref:hypothetical protein n=1 Tax=Streptomyces cinereoruber TaxID=67260 RepID=UPI003626C345
MHTDDHLITTACDMLKAAGPHGHECAVDAVLASVAARESVRGAEATVSTSDTDDMTRLLAGDPVGIEKI